MHFPGALETTPANQNSSIDRGRFGADQNIRAISARSVNITNAARIVDTDAQGKMVLLRQGNNGFTCMPGRPLG
jgi:hypothetical protein